MVKPIIILLTTGIVIVAAQPVTENTALTAELYDVTRCVQEIMRRHFAARTPVLVSAPNTQQHNFTGRSLTPNPRSMEDLQLTDLILHNLNINGRWSIHFVIPADSLLDESRYVTTKFQNYVIFIWEQQEADIVNDILHGQIEYLRDSATWNSRAKFIVVVNTHVMQFTRSLALRICEKLWDIAMIANVVALIPSMEKKMIFSNGKDTMVHEQSGSTRLHLYTFFPFQNGKCGEVKDVVLIDEWLNKGGGSLLYGSNLYQTKYPDNFLGCPFKVASIGVEPYVIAVEEIEQANRSSVPRLTGLAVEPLLLIAERINLTLIFLEPSFDLTLPSYWTQMSTLNDGTSDIAVGAIPLITVVAALSDHTIPYLYDRVAAIMPCPGRIPKVDMIMNVYATSVWIAVALVLILTAVVSWRTANSHHGQSMESYDFRHLSSSFHCAWAIFMGVSVPVIPRTSKLRILFLLYVWYCFAISTVFQAFFTSYLVESGYEEGYKDLDDLVKSKLLYGYNSALEFLFTQFDFVDTRLYNRPRVACPNLLKCAERVLFDRDMATIFSRRCVNYVGIKNGVEENNKRICFLEHPSVSAYVSLFLPKGSLLLDRMNSVLSPYLEAGLLNRYWSHLTLEQILKSKNKFVNIDSEDFVPFSVSHLYPAFKVLLFGHLLSFILFLVELFVGRVWNR
ncbi:hypothetical protein B7P43_G07002 [Cryptotermes secundus]|uniref:Ionotropic glutamate receptor C-terminal domain-containing protein n=1 Tax=Cryptotermes secundus TaxID=105785 RepID=A0A2J7QJL2_9NEOP|nr:hypothetical protein B7P43_G07002 [Cryptotermes secundus]